MPFVTLDKTTRLFYNVYGGTGEDVDPSKPIVLLLHPRFFDHELFAPQYTDTELTDIFNLVAIDLHYHGQTEVEVDNSPFDFEKVSRDVFRLLDALGITSCHVFGESLGALVALWMAVAQNKRVLSLTLCATPPPEETPENLAQFREIVEQARHKNQKGVEGRLPGDMLAAGRRLYFGTWPTPNVARWESKTKIVPSNKALMAKVCSVVLDRKGFPLSEWQKIIMPVLMMHGGADVLYPLDVARRTYGLVPQSTVKSFKVVDGAPHLLSWTHPTVVSEQFMDFMRNQVLA